MFHHLLIQVLMNVGAPDVSAIRTSSRGVIDDFQHQSIVHKNFAIFGDNFKSERIDVGNHLNVLARKMRVHKWGLNHNARFGVRAAVGP